MSRFLTAGILQQARNLSQGIIQEGLMLEYDINNPSSYSGGNIIYDLKGGNTCTLNKTPQTFTDKSSYIIFDGTIYGAVQFNTLPLLSEINGISIVIVGALVSGNVLSWGDNYGIRYREYYDIFQVLNSGGNNAFSSSQLSSKQYIGASIFIATASESGLKIFSNNIIEYGGIPFINTYSGSSLAIGTRLPDRMSESLIGDINYISLYNRELSDEEILYLNNILSNRL